MEGEMRAGLAIIYVLAAMPQVFAISNGLMQMFSLPGPDAAILGFLIGYIPVVGTFAAVEGARIAWGWHWPLGILTFVWTIPVSLALWIPGLDRNRRLSRVRSSSGDRGATGYRERLPTLEAGRARDAKAPARRDSFAANPPQIALAPETEQSELADPMPGNSPSQSAVPAAEHEQFVGSGEAASAPLRSVAGPAYDRLHALARALATRLERHGEDPPDHPAHDEDRTAIDELITAARNHAQEAFDLAAGYLLTGSKGRHLAIAFHLLHGAAESGTRSAQFNIAVMYEHGEGVDRNPDAALEWYRQAAGRNHLRAIFRLADAHKLGELGVPIDPRKEAEWLAKLVGVIPTSPRHAALDSRSAQADSEGPE